MRRRRPLTAIALAMVVAGGPSSVLAGPGRPGEIQVKRDALGEIRRQLEEARARAAAARNQESALSVEVERLDRTLGAKRDEVQKLEARTARLARDLDRLEGLRGRMAEDTVAQQAALVLHLRLLDRLRAAPAAPGWLGERDARRRDRAAADLASIARGDVERLLAVSTATERLGARQQAMSRTQRDLVSATRVVQAERAATETQAGQRRARLQAVREDRETHERRAGDLEESARRLEVLIRELTRRAEARRTARPAVARPGEPPAPRAPAIGLGALRGQLPWPAVGRLVSAFGRQVHPRFGTATLRHGIEIEAPAGAPVRAVHAGAVLYRGWLRGYGNLVVLDHGHGYYTLYAHASEVTVTEGESVRAGQTIARVGVTDAVEGSRVYFEVRYQGRAEDPEAWLGRRP